MKAQGEHGVFGDIEDCSERWRRKLGGSLGRNKDSANANTDNAIGR